MENKKYVIGADIGGTTVKLGLFEEDGALLEKWEIPTVIEGDGTAVLRDIAAEIQKCREKHNIPADGILGVGAGISDGHMVAGANGAAGEFGHMTINPAETETCACGRRGCVQQYVSASGIARLARKYLAEHEEESALRSVEKLTTKDVFDAAKNGDGAANAILENVYDAFGYTISAVCTVADPEVVVIGGGVSKAGEMLVEGVKKGFLKYVFYPNTDVRFNLAVLGNDAGIYGCCKLLLDSLA